MLTSFAVKFSDGRRITVRASTEAAARNQAYRIEPSFPISSIELAA